LNLAEPNSGTIVFTGNVSDQEISAVVDIEGDIIENYSDRTDELSTQVNELRSEVDDSDLNNELTEVSGMVDQINAKWDSGEYQEAKDMFESAEATLDSVEQQADEEPSPGQGQDQDTNGETGGESESSGGAPILPILAVMFIMLLMSGFVFYESYIPEEGDPLYGVLGPE